MSEKESRLGEFVSAYVERRYRDAVAGLLPSLDTPFGPLEEEEPLLHFVLNYVDAMTRRPCTHAYIANRQLREAIEEDVRWLLDYETFLEALKRDEAIFRSGIRGARVSGELDDKTRAFSGFLAAEQTDLALDGEERDALLSGCGQAEGVLRFSQNFVRLRQARRGWCLACGIKEKPYLPLPATSPKGMLPALMEVLEESVSPCIITEPYNLPWKVIGQQIKGKATFLFPTVFEFVQCLQYDDWVDLILSGKHTCVIGEVHLSQQERPGKIDGIALATQNPWFTANAGAWVQTLHDSTTFYELSKSLVFMREGERLGDRRFPALWSEYARKDWHDSHKDKPATLPPLPRPLLPDQMDIKLSECLPIHPKRPRSPKKPLKLTHMMNTVMDHGHAPSEVLRSLVKHHDRERFELSVITTEGGIFRPVEYPFHAFSGKHSQGWGAKTLADLRKGGVDVTVLTDSNQTYQREAKMLAEMLSEREVDIAVFHIPTVITLMAARYCDVPRVAFFDHGGSPHRTFDHTLVLPTYLGLPAYAGFDVIVGCEKEVLKHEAYYQELGTELVAEPIVIDVRDRWEGDPIPRESLNLPSNAFLMTTVSLHLEDRLSPQMIQAVVEILQRVPNAYYCPIGALRAPEYLLKPFHKGGVADRVLLLGYQENPSGFLRGMDLYLNEFPFGGGIALLEAMAAGLPVVSLWDEKGPPQARLGGVYFQKDRMVADPEAYVALACKLAQNPEIHREWRQMVLDHYEKRTDIEGYVRRLETYFAQ